MKSAVVPSLGNPALPATWASLLSLSVSEQVALSCHPHTDISLSPPHRCVTSIPLIAALAL